MQIQHPPDRRLWSQFHNRAEDDTSFAAQHWRGEQFRSFIGSQALAQDNKKQDQNKGGDKKDPNQGGGSQDRNPEADTAESTAS
jgi:hypothetical protein